MFEKRKQKVFEAAKEQGLIEQDETFRKAFIRQTFASPLVLSPMVTMFISGSAWSSRPTATRTRSR